jgi:biotin operon repressor
MIALARFTLLRHGFVSGGDLDKALGVSLDMRPFC